MKTISRKMIRANLPYIGIPVIMAAFFIIHANIMDMFLLLSNSLILLFGYIAAINDLKTKRIPNGLMMMMLAAWIIIMAPKIIFDTNDAIFLLQESVLGLVVGGGLFLLVYLISRKGLGGGDVKFMSCAGLFLGLGGVIPVMLFGTVLAALTGLALILLKKIGRTDKIPLVPFLYIGMLLVIIAL